MAAPTQEYPPWLTAVPTTVYNVAGLPLTTITEIVYLPLTYYGPSIPLGPDWIYGGLTSPAPTQTATEPITTTTPTATGPDTSLTTSVIPPPTALPSASDSLTSSSSAATPTPPVSISLSSSLTSSSSSSTSSSITPIGASNGRLTHSQLVGIVVGSILGFLFLFLLGVLVCLCRKGRRNRREPPFSFTSPADLDGHFEVVDYEGNTFGESSPRQSGGERDPFLQRSGQTAPPPPADAEMGGRGTPRVIPRVPVPGTGSRTSANGNSLTSSGTGTSASNSGYGSVMDRPTLNLDPRTREELEQNRRGPILTPDEMDRITEEHFSEKSPEDALLPPPRLVPPTSRSSNKHASSQYSFNPYLDEDEPATLLTARRVRVDDLASRSTPWLPFGRPSTSNNNNGASSSGGGFFGTLRRLSWFKPSESLSGKRSRPHSADAEAGTSLLGARPDSAMSEKRTLARGLGLDAEKERPVSTLSAHSGTTVFFDAVSSFPPTPVSPGMRAATPPTPLPRAHTPSGTGNGGNGGVAPHPLSQAHTRDSHPPSGDWAANAPADPPAGAPPEYSVTSDTDSIPNVLQGLPGAYDVLDLPAPGPVTHFMSIPSVPSLQTHSIMSGDGSAATSIKTYPLPPGLAFMPSKVWTDTSSPTAGTSALERNNSIGITIDVLEEEPPSPGESWRYVVGGGKRSTFGHRMSGSIPNIPSEDSLYSLPIRSTFPGTQRTLSSGSAPASSRRERDVSNGSYPSVSSPRTTGTHSLVHQSSVSSDQQRRIVRAASPAFSAFNGRSRNGSPPMGSMLLTPPTPVHIAEPERAATGSSRSGSESGGSRSSPPPLSPPLSPSLMNAPWAGGLGDNWSAR